MNSDTLFTFHYLMGLMIIFFSISIAVFVLPQSAHAITCHTLGLNSIAPTGFGVPYSVTKTNTLLLGVDCVGFDATFSVGSGASDEYVYELGYEWDGRRWQPLNLMGANKFDVWYQGKAAATIPNRGPGTSTWVLGYVCSRDGAGWKCGCRDSACTQSFWQAQQYEVTQQTVINSSTSTAATSSVGATHTDLVLEKLARDIHQLSNEARIQAGLQPFAWDDELSHIAILHSEDMAARNYFSHTAPGGCDFTCRYDRAGYKAWKWAENIAFFESGGTNGLAKKFVDGWLNSPPHRRNLLSPDYTHEGIGVSQVGIRYYATANFAEPM